GVAGAPVDQIEFGVVGARAPRRPSSVLPRIAVARPGFGSGFTGSGNRVPVPQLLSGVRVPSIEESARRPLATGHAGNQDAVGDDWCARGVVPLLALRVLLVPELLARFHVEGNEMIVVRDPKHLPVVKHRATARDWCARGSHLQRDRSAPNLAAGTGIERK